VDPLTARRFVTRRLGIVSFAAMAFVVVSAALAVAASPPELWAKRYVTTSKDEIRDAALSPDGSTVFVTGISWGRHQDEYATVAYDAATGVRQWVRRYNGSGNGPDHAYSIAVSPDSTKVFVTGVGYSAGRGQDFATIAYDAATGATVWSKRYSSPGFTSDLAWGVAVSPDGSTVYVTGEDQGVGGTGFDLITIAYDAATGTKTWFQRWSGPGSDGGEAVAVSPDGATVVVAGASDQTNANTDYSYVAVAYDAATGERLWVRRYAGPGIAQDHAYALAFSPDGAGVFVTGNSEGATGPDYGTVAIDTATGAKLWARRYDGPVGGQDYARSIAVSPDGSAVFVTGFSLGANNVYDYATLAYDAATGSHLWTKRYDDPQGNWDAGTSVVVDPDGTTVYVTGNSTDSTGYADMTTFAYDSATGTRLWTARYDGPDHLGDSAHNILISPDGSKLFIAGLSTGATTNWDYATVAYAI
jgi:DNA-binding beta-propeller fold protein YncE